MHDARSPPGEVPASACPLREPPAVYFSNSFLYICGCCRPVVCFEAALALYFPLYVKPGHGFELVTLLECWHTWSATLLGAITSSLIESVTLCCISLLVSQPLGVCETPYAARCLVCLPGRGGVQVCHLCCGCLVRADTVPSYPPALAYCSVQEVSYPGWRLQHLMPHCPQ